MKTFYTFLAAGLMIFSASASNETLEQFIHKKKNDTTHSSAETPDKYALWVRDYIKNTSQKSNDNGEDAPSSPLCGVINELNHKIAQSIAPENKEALICGMDVDTAHTVKKILLKEISRVFTLR
jgi:hypothetical protein